MATDGERCTEPNPPDSYSDLPPSATDERQKNRSYQDEAALQLYKTAGGPKLAAAHATITRAFLKQAEKLEQHYNTPFTKNQIKTMVTAIESIERLGEVLERWHHLIYPNQRPEKTDGQ